MPLPDDPDGTLLANEEARLVERLVARDERAFNALVRMYEGRIYALILRMMGSRAEAEDLAQEVFVQVFKGIGSFRAESRLSTWIYRIAINICKNRIKYLRTRRAGQQEDIDRLREGASHDELPGANLAPIERPDETMSGRQIGTIVQEAILQLDSGFRECLVLRDVEDLSYEEIARITGLAEGTVKSRIHRARAQLRELVERVLGEKIT